MVECLINYRRMKSDFTTHIVPYLNGAIIGFFDKMDSELSKSDLKDITDMIIRRGLQNKDGIPTYVKYANFEIIEYSSYHILIYREKDVIRWNKKIFKKGLYAALNEYILIIEYCIRDYLCSCSELMESFKLSYHWEEEVLAYLNQTLIIFGPEMFYQDGDIYNKLYSDIFFRAYHNACCRLNRGFKNHTSLLLPSVGMVLKEKDKIVKRLTRGKHLS